MEFIQAFAAGAALMHVTLSQVVFAFLKLQIRLKRRMGRAAVVK